MARNLTEGAISLLCSGKAQAVEVRPRLQVWDLRLINSQQQQQQSAIEWYCVMLSDGVHLQQGMLATQKNDLVKSVVDWIAASDLEDDSANLTPEAHAAAWKTLRNAACVLVPSGFGDRGVNGMVLAAKYARENNVPYLGICLGMQISVIEYARSVLSFESANSSEFDAQTPNPVVIFVPEGSRTHMGSTILLPHICFFILHYLQILSLYVFWPYVRSDSMFALLSLHLFMYGCNLFMWKRKRINYNFIFEFSSSTALKYRDAFLICTSVMTAVVGALVVHLILLANGFSPKQVDAIPGALFLIFIGLLICPFNIFYRSTRYCFIRVIRNIVCSPLYKVLMVDFFMADQLTSQVNASGQFCGMAEMTGRVDFNNMDFWQQDKWNGYFPFKWHLIKDVPNSIHEDADDLELY